MSVTETPPELYLNQTRFYNNCGQFPAIYNMTDFLSLTCDKALPSARYVIIHQEKLWIGYMTICEIYFSCSEDSCKSIFLKHFMKHTKISKTLKIDVLATSVTKLTTSSMRSTTSAKVISTQGSHTASETKPSTRIYVIR